MGVGGQPLVIEDDDLVADGNNRHHEDDLYINHIVVKVGLDRFKDLDPNEDQHDETEHLLEPHDTDDKERWSHDVLNYEKTQVDHGKYKDDGHHQHQSSDDKGLEFFQEVEKI